MRLATPACLVALVVVMSLGVGLSGQQAPTPAAASDGLDAAIGRLGDLDYATRTAAARAVRRAPPAEAVLTLLRAVREHADGYVRYRALVLLTGFADPRTRDAMTEAIASPNDRLRTVGYSFFEHQPDPSMIPSFLAALETERAEFVRPQLVRALAALGSDPRVRAALVREEGRGEDFFRSAVIEALGDYHASWAYDAVNATAKLDGPLQDDAALALGRLGDRRALETLAGLLRTAPKSVQPAVVTAICLLDVSCAEHEAFLVETLTYADRNPGYQPLLRGAAAGLSALAQAGRGSALDALLRVGVPSVDPTRAPVALALGTVALRRTPMMLEALGRATDRDGAIDLLREGFDMLEEDLDKERFFAAVRRAYWQAGEGTPARALAEALIQKLDF